MERQRNRGGAQRRGGLIRHREATTLLAQHPATLGQLPERSLTFVRADIRMNPSRFVILFFCDFAATPRNLSSRTISPYVRDDRVRCHLKILLIQFSSPAVALRGCKKISRCPSTGSGRAAKYSNFHCGTPLVVSMSNHERIFSQPLRINAARNLSPSTFPLSACSQSQ